MALTRDYSHYVKELDTGLAHLDLAVEGVSCAGCMAKIERGLSAIPDVTRISSAVQVMPASRLSFCTRNSRNGR